MTGIWNILLMSIILGVTSFGIGILPLFFSFSRTRIAYLSTVGTGLLLGAALGIIIPEGVETLISRSQEDAGEKIALSLLAGFAFMLLVEQLSAGSCSHTHDPEYKYAHSPLPRTNSLHSSEDITPKPYSRDDTDFELALEELEGAENGIASDLRDNGVGHPVHQDNQLQQGKARALPLTLGLVIHSLADGLALGASAFAGANTDGDATKLSFVVFIALIVHKAPTSLALSMSLLSSLPAPECRKHLAVFSAATPIGALASYGILALLGGGSGGWTGIALLISGGTFLYVATVLQPVSHQETKSSALTEMNNKVRVGLIIAGMFIPFLISLIAAHEH